MENATPQPEGWSSRGYLPHFDGGETPQMITFRLADSLPEERLAEWRQELGCRPRSEADVELRRRIERYLDLGHGEALLRNPSIAQLVQGALLHFDGERYRLQAWVVMPNHVHALATPAPGGELGRLVHSWKSFTAQQANRMLGRRGSMWQREYLDRFMRDGRHFEAVVAYIENNPVKARLCERTEDWPFGSARFRGA